MYPILYSPETTNFDNLGEGVLKDTVKGYVVHERNGQYDLELEYLSESRLANKLIKGGIIKADAGKRFKRQLFRIYKVVKSLENNIKIYAYHISYDLRMNVVPRINLTNSTCINALNTIKTSAVLPINFNFYTDITHTANYNVEGADCLSCLGGMQGSIIDTYGNGANIVRDNFNISIMQNAGYDNNVLIAYKKNLLSLEHNDEEHEITGIYPYAKNENGIDENTNTVIEFIELPEKILYRSDYKDFKIQNIIPVDLSESGITTVDDLRKKGESQLEALIGNKLSIKVNFLDKTSLDDFEGLSQLYDLDVYDSVIVRYMKLNVNYKSKINKVKYNILTEKYEEITIGESRTNLSDTVTGTNDFIKQEINKTNNSWKQCIEHATSQITGNSGGHVRMWPPDKPSEIFIMDEDDVNKAKNVLRMNKQGIGFSKNGINGPFETAWTSDGTFYANWITAGILNAELIKAGVLKSFDETTWIDMENGTFNLANKVKFDGSTFSVDLSGEDLSTNESIKSIVKILNDSISSKVSNNDFSSYKEQTANSINSKVSNGDFNTYKEQTAKEISNKVSAGDVSTIVKQNADSLGISINGKLKGTNYNFDGTNFSIGTTNGNDKAYHSATYSRWNHSDGSYTQADSTGIKKYENGTGKTYHYYILAGEALLSSHEKIRISAPPEILKKKGLILAISQITDSGGDLIKGNNYSISSMFITPIYYNDYFEIQVTMRWNLDGSKDMYYGGLMYLTYMLVG